MSYRLLNNIVGWLVFIAATTVYMLTLEPTTSLWDCGEYITTANQMEVGHPPGAPLFMMIGRIFSAFSSPENAAWAVNAMSGLCSSFSILFLFWSITMLARKMAPDYNNLSAGDKLAIIASGAIGAMAYTFTDSFWFSAVEGEVYAMSSFFTAIVFWAILKWETVADRPFSDRWLILIFFLIGLSIGVHLLNLLAIPSICFVYYFKRFKTTTWGVVITAIVSILILGVIQAVFIPGIIDNAAWMERLAVNSMGMGFNGGAIMFFLILLICVSAMLIFSSKQHLSKGGKVGLAISGLILLMLTTGWIFVLPWIAFVIVLFTVKSLGPKVYRALNMSTAFIVVIMIGYSSFAMIVVRSNANPPLDENNPETLSSLSAYLKREQYGSWPIAYGPYWNSPGAAENSDKNPTYVKAYVLKKNDRALKREDRTELAFNNHRAAKIYNEENNLGADIVPEYIMTDDGVGDEQEWDPRYCTYFPRMYRQGSGPLYMKWCGYEGNKRFPLPLPQSLASGNNFDNLAEYVDAIDQQIQQATFNRNAEALQQLKAHRNSITKDGIYKPTYGENMTYMFKYQFGWMYFRYFLWNFAGRQNDLQGYAGIGGGDGRYLEGNWLSGVKPIDETRLGSQEDLPNKVVDNPGYNRYYFLPLILGLIGLVYQAVFKPKDWFVVMLLFFFTGLAICIYLNQKPAEPRERDYAYAASFYAFSIWIGLGVWALFDAVRRVKWKGLGIAAGVSIGFGLFTWLINAAFGMSLVYMSVVAVAMIALMMLLKNFPAVGRAALALLITIPVPWILAAENWDDHDRSNRYTARDIAKAYLDSCDKNAILFTHGDNDTFPLWYVQEVEKYRTDVRVVNLSLLGTDWHVNQAKRKAYLSEPVPFTAEEYQYRQGTRDVVYFFDREGVEVQNHVPAIEVYNRIMSPSSLRVLSGTNVKEPQYTFNQRKVKIPVNKKNAIESGIADTNMIKLPLEDEIKWSIKGTMIKSDLMVLDLLAHYDWTRPIYFAGNAAAHSGLQPYFQFEGLTLKLTPFKTSGQMPRGTAAYQFHEDKTYHKLMANYPEGHPDKTKEFAWGNIGEEGVLVDYYTMRMVHNLRSQFLRFSDELIRNGQVANQNNDPQLAKKRFNRAEDILDRCLEVLPIDNVPPDDLTYYLVGNYYDLAFADTSNTTAKTKAKDLALTLGQDRLDDLYYFASLDNEWLNKQISEIGKAFLHMEMISQAARDEDVLAEIGYGEVIGELGVKFQTLYRDLDRDGKTLLQKQLTNRNTIPPSITATWFPQWFNF